MPRSTVSPEVRAAALADLHAGEQPAVVAERYGLDRGMVKMWKQRYVTDVVTIADGAPVSVIHRPQLEMQQLELGELVMMNLRAKLIATQRIADYASSPAWIDKQNASDVAELFEVIDRSAISVLDRLARRAYDGEDKELPDVPDVAS